MLSPHIIRGAMLLETSLQNKDWTREAFIKFMCEQPDMFAKYFCPPELKWQEIARTGEKINAIKAYREHTGAGLGDAKFAVEDWMQQNGIRPYYRG